MSTLSRRDFVLRAAAAGAGALAADKLFALQPAAKPADMTIARWTGPKELSPNEFQKAAVKATEQALAGLGGLSRFVHKGDVVWVKPNIGWDRTPEQGANTNPDVVATIIRLCFEAGAKTVKVGDNPCDVAQKTYVTSGIAAAAKAAGAEVLFLDPSRARDTAIGGERIKSIPIFPAIMETDLVINVPVAKHHRLAELTLCMKNYMGVIDKRNLFHQDIPTCLADLTRFLKPRICVLDCMRVLTAHGPKGGNLADVAAKMTVAAGVDIVAMDAFGAEIMGRKPQDVSSIVKGEKWGLGKVDYRSLALREISVS
jgi:uncharacterized protein (DUF362 family)